MKSIILTLVVLNLGLMGCQTTVLWATPTPLATITSTATPTAIHTPTVTPTPTPDPAFEADQPLVGRVNGTPIYQADYQRRLAWVEAGLAQTDAVINQTLRQQVVDSLVDDWLIGHYATNQGITVTMQITEPNIALAEWLSNNQLEQAQFLVDSQQQQLTQAVYTHVVSTIPLTQEQVYVQQIVVDDKTVAETVLANFAAGQPFADLAAQYSKVVNYELGWLPRQTGILPPEVEAATFALTIGQTTQPLLTPEGFYLVWIADRQTAPLTQELYQHLQRRTFQQWLADQRSSARIEYYAQNM